MKNLFLVILVALVIFSQVMPHLQRNENRGLPVITWLGAPNPDRVNQIRLFRTWLSNRGYPDMDVRVDMENGSLQKTVIHGVAGVAGDIPEFYSGQIPFVAQMGILDPLDNLAKQFGLPKENHYPVLHDDLFVEGVRYAYPCNASVEILLVNEDAFQKLNLPAPPYRWDFETFEQIGRSYVRAGNADPGKKRLYFFASFPSWMPHLSTLRRSLGIGFFNETLTAPRLNDPRYADFFRRYYRWIYEEHFITTPAEASSFSIESGGFSGMDMQLFARGNYAMIFTGRHAITQFRRVGYRGRLSAAELPHGGYPNVRIQTRMIALYKGSKQKELAKHFFAFFTSPELNMHVVEESDAIPPVPGYTEREEFLRPKGRENEWKFHQGIARALKENAFSFEYSPFLQKTLTIGSLESKYFQAFASGLMSAEEALGNIEEEVKKEMRRYLKQHPELAERYEAALERQKKIDVLRMRGEKIPLDLVDNPFLKKYYRDSGKGI